MLCLIFEEKGILNQTYLSWFPGEVTGEVSWQPTGKCYDTQDAPSCKAGRDTTYQPVLYTHLHQTGMRKRKWSDNYFPSTKFSSFLTPPVIRFSHLLSTPVIALYLPEEAYCAPHPVGRLYLPCGAWGAQPEKKKKTTALPLFIAGGQNGGKPWDVLEAHTAAEAFSLQGNSPDFILSNCNLTLYPATM